MTKRDEKPTPHLAPVPKDAPAADRIAFEHVELPTGGQTGIGGLLHELARHAFPGSFAGFTFEVDSRGPRCVVTVQTNAKFTREQVDAARLRIIRALVGFEIIKVAQPAPEAQDSAPEDGAQSPPPAQQSPSTSAE